MNTISSLLNFIGNTIKNIQTPIVVRATGISVPSASWTQLCKITLPANGKYLLLGMGTGSTVANGSTIAVGLNKVSGTLVDEVLGGTTGSTVGGGAKCVCGYVETDTSTVIELREFLYGSGTTSNALGWIIAIPLKA